MAGIYVHIPFCARRCTYCDFFSTLSLKESGEAYVQAVIDEAALRRDELRGETVKTLYLGGGTPSQLPIGLLQTLVHGIGKVIPLAGVEEFTIEANPDDITPQWCDALLPLGVNRVSMGVQSFEDRVLSVIGRRHTANQAVEAVSLLRQAGINNISIDLIYGLPGQTVASWTDSVAQAIALKPQHISAYGLTYEPGTPLWRQRERGDVTEATEEQYLAMYETLVSRLKAAGYEHYEVSNFALPGYHSRHNSSYWNETPYLGLGTAAHSFDGKVRRSNPHDLKVYIDKILSGEVACIVEEMSWQERYDERVMLALRTASGVDTDRLRQDFGDTAWQHFVSMARPHLEAGNLSIVDGTRYALTDKGIMLSDSIIRDLFWEE